MEKKNYWQYFTESITKNYANFEGRARRTEYWSFQLWSFIISFVLSFTAALIDPSLSIISTLFSLAILVPAIAAAVRRMHDVGKSGWYILIPIYNLILTLTDGDKGPNEFGADPKNPTEGNEVEQIGTE
jgi:uncharacterized membrane protein YhaH (DUF805 family)